MYIPNVLINGQKLSEAQVLTMKLAFNFLDSDIATQIPSRSMNSFTKEHKDRLSEINTIITHQPRNVRGRSALAPEEIEVRNLEIYEAISLKGESQESLAAKHNLSMATIKKIVIQHEIQMIENQIDANNVFDGPALEKHPSLLIQPVSILKLTSRASNAMLMGNIFTIGELINKSDSDLRKIPNMGNTSIREIKLALGEYQLSLKNTK